VTDLRPAGVAAFDFDGTLVSRDSFGRFLSHLLGPGRFARTLACSGPAMSASYRRAGRDGAKAALLARTLAGIPVQDVVSAGEEFGGRLASEIRPEMSDLMYWHDSQGHERILVSASLAVYLEPLGRATGFSQVIATRLEADDDGRLTGRLDGTNVRAAEKALRLQQVIHPDAEIWAYGDSAGDVELLAMAHHPVWVGRRRRSGPQI
jgi:phosphatidylglycerophosphatase C